MLGTAIGVGVGAVVIALVRRRFRWLGAAMEGPVAWLGSAPNDG
ncbi:hypothetical protein ACH5AG_38685 [Streptomyces anulatus]